MKIENDGKNVTVKDISCFNLDLTLDCGEAFRWKKCEDGFWRGVAFECPLAVKQSEDGSLTFLDTTLSEFSNIWQDYFDLGRDYASICNQLSKDEYIAPAVKEYYGIRILKQEPWEALASFVVSQQNNIPRIKGIIERLCKNWGREVALGVYSFPAARDLARLTEGDLREIGLGYRAPYILGLARDVDRGEVDLTAIAGMEMADAKRELLKIRGVGTKVADCALLFGFNFLDCFPVDVWIERAKKHYPLGLPECFKPYSGVAQQYLYHWVRNHKED